MKKVLVIGGLGNIGAPLVDYLCESQKYEVYVVSRNHHKGERSDVTYYFGDAMNGEFMKDVLKIHFDAIVDFVKYPSAKFPLCAKRILDATNQYISTSTCRVYAPGAQPISEGAPRFLDVQPPQNDEENLWYQYEKAKNENWLMCSPYSNWTIIRPHITFGPKHLVIGLIGHNSMLNRTISGNKFPVPMDMGNCHTTYTYANDVAKMIYHICGKKSLLGEVFNLVNPHAYSWVEIAEMYAKGFANYDMKLNIGYVPNYKVFIKYGPKDLINDFENDRLLERTFTVNKLEKALGMKFVFTDVQEAITKSIGEFLETLKGRDIVLNPFMSALMDNITKEQTKDDNWTPEQLQQYVALCTNN